MALLAVVADGLHGAAFHSLGAQGDFLVRHGLLANKGKALVIIAGEEVRGGFRPERQPEYPSWRGRAAPWHEPGG